MKKILLIIFLLPFLGFTQVTGDYRSSFASGNTGSWTSLSSWQYYNGSSWVTPTTGQGYPGQNAGTGAVLIQAGHTITIGTSGITTQTMGTVTISGKLSLTGLGTGQGTAFNINTSKLIVTPGLSPAATIAFEEKVSLVLPSNVDLQVSTGGLSTNNGCNNNQEIKIGSTAIAFCSGNPTFATLMSQGGYNTAGTLSGNQYLCLWNTSQFNSTVSGGAWSSSNNSIATISPTGLVTAVGEGTATITYTKSGKAEVRAVYIANNGGGGGITAINGSNSQCQGSTANYTITSANTNYNHTWSYSGTGVTFVTSADGRSATATFAPNATTGTQQITVYSTNGCGTGYGINMNVTVAPTSNGGNVSTTAMNWCFGSDNKYIGRLNLSGYVGTVQYWQYSTVSDFSSGVMTRSDEGYGINIQDLSQTTYYRAVVQNLPCTNIAYSNVCKVTVSNTAPSAAGGISGPSSVCPGQTGVAYSVPAIANAAGYNWNLPAGATIASGTNTNSITVNFSTSASSGNITVQGTNGCGTGTSSSGFAVTVAPRATISYVGSPYCKSLTALQAVTQTGTGITGGTYTVSPSGLIINSSNGSITPSTSTAGTYTVTYTYASGTCAGLTTTTSVTISAIPTTASVGGTQSRCASLTTASLGGNTPTVGTGTWTQLSGPGTSTFSGVNSGTSTATASVVGTYVYRWTISNGSCTSSTADVTVDYYAAPTTASVGGTQSICVSLTTASLGGNTPTLGTGTWTQFSGPGTSTFSGVNSGASTATASVVGTYVYRWTISNGSCTSSTADVTVNYYASPSAPTVGTITQPNCSVLTGSIKLEGLPSSGTWTVTRSPGNVPTTGTGTETTISGLSAGSYTFTVNVPGGCVSDASSPVTVNAFTAVIATWNGSWSFAPTEDTRVEFITNYSSKTDLPAGQKVLKACSCYVKNNAVVTFNGDDNLKEGHTLNVINKVKVESGSLTFENNASLVQVNEDPNINEGNISYYRHTAAVKRYDYTYWSSPVAGQRMHDLSPNTFYDKYYSYNSDQGKWEVNKYGTLEMKIGEGYIIRAPQDHDINTAKVDDTPVFKGVPNNGKIEKSLTGGKLYLLGNPYPSALDADVFLEKNEDELQGTLYFWTHNTPPSDKIDGDKKYNYTTADYATYNRTGGVDTAPATITVGGATSSSGAVLTGKIAAGQGFFAPASTAGGTLEYNNTMRVGGGTNGTNNSQFFKLSTAKTATTTVAKTEKSRIWLNLTNSEGAFKQTLVGYVAGATNDYEGSFDGVSYDGNAYVDFYSVNNEKNLTIQGRALPFVKKDSVALGYKSTIIGDFQISIDQTDGVLSTENVFLEDKDLKVVHDLKKGAYTFTTQKGTFNNRFVLRYVDKNAIEIVPEIPEDLNTAAIVSVKNSTININSSVEIIDSVIIYNVAGRKLYQKNKVADKNLVVQNMLSSHQVLVVKIALENGKTVTSKIIY